MKGMSRGQKQVLLEEEQHLSPQRGPDGAGGAGDPETATTSAPAWHRAAGHANHPGQYGTREELPLEKGPGQWLHVSPHFILRRAL